MPFDYTCYYAYRIPGFADALIDLLCRWNAEEISERRLIKLNG